MTKFRDLLMILKKDEEGLPSEYQAVEYIQSNGNQYIDTGVGGTSLGEYEIKMSPLSSRAIRWEQYFAGQMYTETTVGKLYENSSNFVYQGYPYARNLYAIISPLSNNAFEVSVKDGGVYSNGTKLCEYTPREWGTHTFYIFGSHSESLYASMRLYYLKMYSDGIKVRDYIPCYRKIDGVIGLYDLVSKTFFTNQGSGLFTKGSDVN